MGSVKHVDVGQRMAFVVQLDDLAANQFGLL